jgi:hypothetical protein
VFFFLWVAAVSELVGLPAAWIKVRRTAAWRERPRDVRGIDLLERFIRPLLWETGPFAFAVLALAALLAWALGLSQTAAGFVYGLVFVIPALLVGWAASKLEPEEFAALVEEHRRGVGGSPGN